MEIDDFINKYLDGELTPDEDAEFRELLAQNSSAAEHFHSMLLLHSTLKEDAENIKLPINFEEIVEERLLASFLQMIPHIEFRKSRARKRAIFLMSLFLFFLFFVLNIQDGKISSSYSIFLSELWKQEDVLRNIVQNQAQNEIIESFSQTNFNVPSKSYKNYKSNARYQISSLNVPNINVQTLGEHIEKTASKLNSLDLVETFPIADNKFSNDEIRSIWQNRNFLQLQELAYSRGINVTRNRFKNDFPQLNFFASGVYFSTLNSNDLISFSKGNVKSKGFSNFAQSVGYSVAKGFRLGIEFGYSELSFDQRTEILIPVNSFEAPKVKLSDIHKRKDYSRDNALANESGSDDGGKNFVRVPIDITLSQRIIWGAIFFEHLFPVNNILCTVSRVSIGSADGGLFGSIRFFGEIEPVNGVSLIVGTEGKTMWIRTPISSKAGLRTSFGFLYGISFKFDF